MRERQEASLPVRFALASKGVAKVFRMILSHQCRTLVFVDRPFSPSLPLSLSLSLSICIYIHIYYQVDIQAQLQAHVLLRSRLHYSSAHSQ
mmetsp:Transcript_49183/g.41503  ORF Transcript_49183/g.41503 Transcript_49183/m.41503 type:complete len:91 (+) Transcript_49183:1852-2124(+)